MTKQQLILIFGGIVLLLLIGVGVTVFFLTRSTTAPPPGPITNPFGNTVLPGAVTSGKQIPIRTSSGTTISVPDFLAGHEATELPNGLYYSIYGPEYSPEGFTFTVTYSEPASEFQISLIAEPIGTARLEAERYLKGMLTLTTEELCGLNIAITVTPNINETYSKYENLGLSFCPGSVKLP